MLTGKRILIVGASRGIGEAIARECAAEHASVVLTGRKPETLQPVVDSIREQGEKADFIVWDIKNVTEGPSVFDRASEMMGGIDIVINNAGVIGRKRLYDVDEEEWNMIFDTNVKGAFFCMQTACKFFEAHNAEREVKGKIIVVSSETGHQPCVHPYGISKWSVMGMCQGYAKAFFKRGIVVQNIAPGPVTTEMMNWTEGKSAEYPSAFGRMAYPKEIAELAVFLASDKSNRIAGQPIYINGGLNC